ncbi:MAG: ABC transporter permease [Deltaproteobacteria bacterium]|nr:ABC transporter permease [Deltaproteobacteria bacterium]
MTAVWSVALITFKEGIKNRIIFGIFIIALLLFAATTILTTLFMRDIVKVAVDLSLSTVSFAGLLTLLFIGVNLFGKDLDKRTIYMVISRPVSRSQYLIGKFLGIVLLSFVVVAFLGILSAIPVILSKRFYYYPEARFDWWIYFIAVIYIFIKLAIVSAIITLFASFTSNSFIALVLSLVAYIIGQSTESVRGLLASQVEKIDVSPILSYMVEIAYYVFPNISAFDLKTQAAHGLSINPSYIIWTALYAIFYMTIAVVIGTLAFKRREFP